MPVVAVLRLAILVTCPATVVFKIETSTPSTVPLSVILLPLSVTPPIVLLPLADRLAAVNAPALPTLNPVLLNGVFVLPMIALPPTVRPVVADVPAIASVLIAVTPVIAPLPVPENASDLTADIALLLSVTPATVRPVLALPLTATPLRAVTPLSSPAISISLTPPRLRRAVQVIPLSFVVPNDT